jgi:hypothetical protein
MANLDIERQFPEVHILRLTATRPARLSGSKQAKEILGEIKKLRSYMKERSYVAPYKDLGFTVTNGWGRYPYGMVYVTSASKIAKLGLLIEDLEERVIQLEAEDRQKAEALRRSEQAAKQFVQAGEDKALAGALWHALDSTPPTVGFVYLKRWNMPDGSCWYKVGITNNPDRRETEQNVLPVAAETIACVDVGSVDRARAIEAVIHHVLDEQRITNANNRELFHLSEQQASAVKSVLERLE